MDGALDAIEWRDDHTQHAESRCLARICFQSHCASSRAVGRLPAPQRYSRAFGLRPFRRRRKVLTFNFQRRFRNAKAVHHTVNGLLLFTSLSRRIIFSDTIIKCPTKAPPKIFALNSINGPKPAKAKAWSATIFLSSCRCWMKCLSSPKKMFSISAGGPPGPFGSSLPFVKEGPGSG